MGFKAVKQQVINCIEQGTYDHEVRRNIDVKNLFQCGQLSDEYIIELLKATKGNQYNVSPHHLAPSIDVHVFKPTRNGRTWYIKFYFIEPEAMFISVHESSV